MKVLHLNPGNLFGGIEIFLLSLLRSRFLCPGMVPAVGVCFESKPAEEYRKTGVPVHVLGNVRFSRPWTILRARRALARVLAGANYDVVICHENWTHALFAPVVRATRSKLVLWSQDRHPGTGWLDRLARRTRPDAQIVSSRYSTEQLLFPDVTTEVIHCPVEPPEQPRVEPSVVRQQFNTPADAVVIGAGGLKVDTQGGNAQIPTVLSGTGSLTKVGAGRLRLTPANTYAGGTSVEEGLLEITNSGALGSGNVALGSAELRAFSSATLSGNLSGGIQLVSVNANQTGTFSAAPNQTLTLAPLDFLLVSGSTMQVGSSGQTGTVVFAPTGAVALPADVSLNVAAGTLVADSSALEFATAIASSTTVASGATLDFQDHLSTSGINALFGEGTVNTGSASATKLVVNSGNFAGNLAGNGGLVKESNGTLTLAGQTSFVGGTTVNAGTLLVNGSLSNGFGNAEVNTGATLGGSGLVAPTLQPSNPPTLRPSDPPTL